MIKSCTHSHLINPSLHGANLGYDAVMPTMTEELQDEISQSSKCPLVHRDYDATACYDCIVLSLSSLIS